MIPLVEGNIALAPSSSPEESHSLEINLDSYYQLLKLYSRDPFHSLSWRLFSNRSGDSGRVIFPANWPDDMRILSKICVLNYLAEGCRISTCSKFLHNCTVIFEFLQSQNIGLNQLRPGVISDFISAVDKNELLAANYQKNGCMRAFQAIVDIASHFGIISYPGTLDLSFRWKEPVSRKRAPDHCVIEQMDKLFFNINTPIPLEYRCLYMVLRLRANRISEALSMPLECISYPEMGVFDLSIPTQKETPYHEPIYAKYSFLLSGQCESVFFELMKEQQELVRSRQFRVNDACKDYFFLSPSSDTVVTVNSFNAFLEHFCNQYQITDVQGRQTKITSHDFRHIAVCERLSSELITPYQTMVECNHSNIEQTMGYGYPSLHDETKHLADISSEVFNFTESKKTAPTILPKNKYDRLLDLPATRILPGYGACINESCVPRFEKCFRCHSFNPDPIYQDYMNAAIKLLENKNEKLLKKGASDIAIKRNQHQIKMFRKYLEKCSNLYEEKEQAANGY